MLETTKNKGRGWCFSSSIRFWSLLNSIMSHWIWLCVFLKEKKAKRDYCLLYCLNILVLSAGENLRCSFWKIEELLCQINCEVQKTTAIDFSDIRLDADILEGDAYDFLTHTHHLQTLLLSVDMSIQLSKTELCLCGAWFYVPLDFCGLEKIRAFQVTSALRLVLSLIAVQV